MNRTAQATIPVDFNDLKTGFQSGRVAALSDWNFRREQREFEKVVRVLRAKKWARENRERYLELQRRYQKRHQSEGVVRLRSWRHARVRELVFACANPECGVQWCRVPGGDMNGNKRTAYCSKRCVNRARYLRGMNGGWAARAASARVATRAQRADRRAV